MLLSENDIKAELSYAYLHAVAVRAGLSCSVTNRLGDSAGVDATLRFKEKPTPDAVIIESLLEVQLKSTSSPVALQNGRYSFFLRRDHYDKLRSDSSPLRRFLVVLFLPEDSAEWLTADHEQLSLRRCAYWCSLRGANETTNKTGQTVYLPQTNIFSVEGLRAIVGRVARNEEWCDGTE